jgi:hypothetical protein
MQENNPVKTKRCHRQRAGATVVEFALVIPIFLLFVFAVMELARALYVINMLQEVTRRAGSAAASANFNDLAIKDSIRRSAVFDDTSGLLPVGYPITSAHVRIDYLSIARDSSGVMSLSPIPTENLPASPARNNLNCIKNPYGSDCIRLVRVRICDPANNNDCDAAQYRPAFPMIDLSFGLPRATTVLPAETLGFVVGDAP